MYLKGFDNQDIYTKRSGLLRADSKEEFTNRGGGGEQNREEGEMAQKRLGGGRNRGKK